MKTQNKKISQLNKGALLVLVGLLSGCHATNKSSVGENTSAAAGAAPVQAPASTPTPAPQNYAGPFVSVGAMVSARVSPVTTVLRDGSVLVVGGTQAGNSLQTAEVYDPLTQRFSATAGNMARFGATTATLLQDGSVLVAGGTNGPLGGGTNLSLETYDSMSGQFTATGVSLTSAPKAAVLLASGKVLFLEGYDSCDNDGRIVAHEAELYDPQQKTVTFQNFSGGTVGVLLASGKVLVRGLMGCKVNAVTGGYFSVYSSHAKVFDPLAGLGGSAQETSGRSFTYPDGQGPVPSSGLVLNDGTVFFSDYLGGTTYYQVYDPLLDTFSLSSQVVASRSTPVVELGNGTLLLADFSNGGVDSYDPSNQILTSPVAATQFDHSAGGVLVKLQNGDLLAVGTDGADLEGEIYEP